MEDPKNKPAGSEPPPNDHKNPRRTLPENSVTLRHHRMGREVLKRHTPDVKPPVNSPRRNSSGESNETGVSDPKRWFDSSNLNAAATLDTTAMDVDPPFYQRETDSSNEEGNFGIPSQSPAYRFVQSRPGLGRPGITHSSSADDYRSVIDDLTVENKRLKEELKRYKQKGPDSLRKDKLFEVKVHGLPGRKKRQLEAALRDFATSLDGSDTPSQSRKKIPGKGKGVHSSTGVSKHASSSSGSNSRPVDSAYASMSTGPGSSVPSLPNQAKSGRQRYAQRMEAFMKDIPQGLWPQTAHLTDQDKKKLVVRRLEHLFTGKMIGLPEMIPGPLAPVIAVNDDAEVSKIDVQIPPSLEASREAQILPPSSRQKENHSRDNVSISNSNVDQSDSRGAENGHGSGSGSGSGSNESPPEPVPPEQRPTRPRDLDPDRVQVPAENMDYIRHLGLRAPQSQKQFSAKDVSPDAEGWVYLNLLSNLAQLHMLNVTPDFICSAVSEKSAKFQLSPDGRKIRWRGGDENTRFSSDSSSSNSQKRSPSGDTDGSNDQDQRKARKVAHDGNDVIASETSKFGPQISSSSDDFHYKPLFVHQQTSSSEEQPSAEDETGSSLGPAEESNLGMNSKWNQSGVSGVSHQRKRRRDGAIIYYSGAPFCTDLSGDLGEVSPDTYMASSEREPLTIDMGRPGYSRSASGSSLPFKFLSEDASRHVGSMDVDEPPELIFGDSDPDPDELDADFPWSNLDQISPLHQFDASGLAGITPEDHFVLVVQTRRPKQPSLSGTDNQHRRSRSKFSDHVGDDTLESKEIADSIIGQLATMTTGSPRPSHLIPSQTNRPFVGIEYVSGRLRLLPPAPLPPAAYFFHPFSSGSDDSDEDTNELYDDDAIPLDRQITRHPDDAYLDNAELSSNDEEDELSDRDEESGEDHRLSDTSMKNVADPVSKLGIRRRHGRPSLRSKLTTGSSVATAGGAASRYNSSIDEA